MSEIYFTYKKQPKATKENQLNLFDAILNNTEIEEEKHMGYPQFITLKFDDIAKIKDTNFTRMQYNLIKTKLKELTRKALKFIDPENPNKEFYNFKIPKTSGGLRLINAPYPELKMFLLELKNFFQNTLHILPHNAAHAYVPNRSPVTAIQRHQYNHSKWFEKMDITNFFPSCSEEFIHQQLRKIFPFCLMYKNKSDIATMDIIVRVMLFKYDQTFGLPQGTPISPFITNILMIPIDYEIHNLCRQYEKQHFVYTRYADDIFISSKYDFDFKKIENEIKLILSKRTPFEINEKKTRYGSSTGRNWNLGLMLNAENNITIGYRRKRDIKQKLLNYCQYPEKWTPEDIKSFHGELSYFLHIEKDYAEHVLKEYSQKYNSGIDILEQMRTSI